MYKLVITFKIEGYTVENHRRNFSLRCILKVQDATSGCGACSISPIAGRAAARGRRVALEWGPPIRDPTKPISAALLI